MSNKPETLGTYIRKVLDVNKDGQVTFKDFISLFPNQAIAIAVLFVDVLIAFAEYRVWDVGMRITQDPLKAIGFVAVSALPFYLGQIFWLYPHAVFFQKCIAVGMVVGGLYMSAEFGLADLTLTYDVAFIVSLVIRLTIAYVIAVLLYIVIDPNIKAWRAKVTAYAALEQERNFQTMTREMLKEWQATAVIQKETIDMFGDEDAVIAQLQALRGKSGKPAQMPAQPKFQPMNAPAQEVDRLELAKTGKEPNPQNGSGQDGNRSR